MRTVFLACLALASGVVRGTPSAPDAEPARAFSALKIYDPAGRPWRAAIEDWTGARQRIAIDPAWAGWVRDEERAVDAWMARQRDYVEWRCGSWHDFVSPNDGSRLVWTSEVPGQEVAFLHSDSDSHVELTPKLFAAWVFQFRSNHADLMRRAAALYRLKQDQRYAAWAAAQMDFYADHYLDWAENRDGARLYWQTLDVATSLAQYAATVRLLGDYVKPERRANWFRRFFLPQVGILNRTSQNIHNIATWHRAAAMQVGLVFDDADLWRGALDGEFGFRQQIARGITRDSVWWEQSFGYNNYVVRAALGLFTIAGICGRADELSAEMAAAENLLLAPIYLRFPDGHAPNPADNAGPPLTVPDPATLAAVYRVFPTTLGLQVAAGTRNWDTLLDPPSPAPPTTSLPPVASRNLESTRMALLRADGWQVFFHYGQLTRSHAQAEALNFTAFYGETDISHDPGTVGYGSPLHRGYYTRGLNHNVPLIDGEGGEPPQPGELGAYSAAPPRVSARQPRYRPNASASRTLAIVGGSLVDVATIASEGAPARLGLALHLQGAAELPPGFAADPVFAENRPASFGYWRDVRRAVFRDRTEIQVHYQGLTLQVRFEAKGAFILWHAWSPDRPPHWRESFYLELTAPASEAVFTTTLTPMR